jgi:hypothetical protein
MHKEITTREAFGQMIVKSTGYPRCVVSSVIDEYTSHALHLAAKYASSALML